jgi:septal ring factor EnvC (AmiA/AmiB activator)
MAADSYHSTHSIAVPGGWIYWGDFPGAILVSDPAVWRSEATRGLSAVLAELQSLRKDIATMSETLDDQINAIITKLQADTDQITAQIAAEQAKIADLTAELQPGSTVTQAQVDTLNAVEARLSALATPVVVTAPDPPPAA